MSFFEQLESLAGGAAQGSGSPAVPAEQQSSISRALVSSLAEHPGGVGGLLEQFRQNGMGEHVNSWVNNEPGQGAPQQLSPQQVEQGAGPELLQSVAQRSGLPQGVVTGALTSILPLVLQHMTPGGQVPQQGEFGGVAQGLLSHLL